MHPPLTTVQILAIGFLLVILSAALFQNYLTLLVVATYVLAPVPNWLCGKAQAQDDFMDGGSNSIVELGRFITGFLVVMGIGTYSDTIHFEVWTTLTHQQHCPLCWRIASRSRYLPWR